MNEGFTRRPINDGFNIYTKDGNYFVGIERFLYLHRGTNVVFEGSPFVSMAFATLIERFQGQILSFFSPFVEGVSQQGVEFKRMTVITYTFLSARRGHHSHQRIRASHFLLSLTAKRRGTNLTLNFMFRAFFSILGQVGIFRFHLHTRFIKSSQAGQSISINARKTFFRLGIKGTNGLGSLTRAHRVYVDFIEEDSVQL